MRSGAIRNCDARGVYPLRGGLCGTDLSRKAAKCLSIIAICSCAARFLSATDKGPKVSSVPREPEAQTTLEGGDLHSSSFLAAESASSS